MSQKRLTFGEEPKADSSHSTQPVEEEHGSKTKSKTINQLKSSSYHVGGGSSGELKSVISVKSGFKSKSQVSFKNEPSKIAPPETIDEKTTKEQKKGKEGKGKDKKSDKAKKGKGKGKSKKDAEGSEGDKPGSESKTKEETSVVGLSNEELVKKLSQRSATKSKSSMKKSKSKLKSKMGIDEEEGDEDQAPPVVERQSWEGNLDDNEDELPQTQEGEGEGQGQSEGEDDGQGQSEDGDNLKRKSRRNTKKSKMSVKSEKTLDNIKEKGQDEPAEVKDKKEKKGKGKGKDKDEEKEKGKGKKGKKGKGVKEEKEQVEVKPRETETRLVKPAKSSITDRKISVRPSTSFSTEERTRSRHKRRTKFEDDESESSSSDGSLTKASTKEFSRLYEEDEVLQKIIVPSVTSTTAAPSGPSITKPEKKPKPKKGKTPPKKGQKPKKEKNVKTEAQLEEEAKVKAEEERIKDLQDKKYSIEKEKRELLEASMRDEQLDQILYEMEACTTALQKVTQAEQAAEEWRQYLVCDGLPAPWDVPGMNTYLHLWEQEVYTVSSEICKNRTNEAINLLNQLEDILDDPFDCSPRKLYDWAWVSSRFREYQSLNMEYCTYSLLRDIKTKLNRIDIPTSDFRLQEEWFSLCLWVSITLPTPTPNPRSVTKPRISLKWPEMSVDVLFPQSLKRDLVAVRGMYTKYDHLTDTSSSYLLETIPAYYKKSLKEACFEELKMKMKYKYDNRVINKKPPLEVTQEDGTIVTEEPESEPELDTTVMPPPVPYQKLEISPSDLCLTFSNEEIADALRQLSLTQLPESVINLRKFTVIGGLYYIDLFYQPPQPQGMVSYEVFISTLTEPYSLQTAPFIVNYDPPPPHEPGTRRTPEEIEEELLQQEKELDELIYLELTLPKHVYWLEPPMVVQWNDQQAAWTTNTIYDFKNIEEKGYVTFRTGIFRPFGIATLRWSNLPYQAWEIRPEKDGTVSFQLSCAILTLEFHVVKNKICVRDIQSAPNDAFDEHLNVYYHFSKLRKIMKAIGIDVFPFFDTFLYVEGTCEKHWPTENHLYFCMAYMSVVFQMTWSRWNMTLDYRSIVFQMRAYRFDRPKQANFDTVLVSAQRTLCINCTEVSPEFTDEPAEGMRFFADLWQMVRTTTTKSMRTCITNADKTMVKTLYRLYKNVRFLSFS